MSKKTKARYIPPSDTDAEQEYARNFREWQDEEAERVNQLSQSIREAGITSKATSRLPPLNPDGSQKISKVTPLANRLIENIRKAEDK